MPKPSEESDHIGPIHGRNPDGEPVCYALLRKSDGKRCMRRNRTSPTGRCIKHGGAKFIGRPPTTGEWSSKIPPHLKLDYEAQLANPDLTAMRQCIALLDALIGQYLEGLLRHPPVSVLKETADELELALVQMLPECEAYPIELEDAIAGAVEKLRLVAKNREEEREVRKAMRERAELVKAEAVRVEKASRFITAEQMMALVSAIASIVNRYVSIETERAQISQALVRLVDRGPSSEDRSEILDAHFQEELPDSGAAQAAAS